MGRGIFYKSKICLVCYMRMAYAHYFTRPLTSNRGVIQHQQGLRPGGSRISCVTAATFRNMYHEIKGTLPTNGQTTRGANNRNEITLVQLTVMLKKTQNDTRIQMSTCYGISIALSVPSFSIRVSPCNSARLIRFNGSGSCPNPAMASLLICGELSP